MNYYDEIYEELCDRVEYGELSLEDAEIINDVAYERYVLESDKKYYEPDMTEGKIKNTLKHKYLDRKYGMNYKAKEKYIEDKRIQSAKRTSEDSKIEYAKKLSSNMDKTYEKFMEISKKNINDRRLESLMNKHGDIYGKIININFIDRDTINKNKDMKEISRRYERQQDKMNNIFE